MKILYPALFVTILMTWTATFFTQGSNAQQPGHTLMPAPAEVQFASGNSGLGVGKSFSVAVRGHNDQRLESGINRAVRRLEGRTGLDLKRGLAADPGVASLVIECRDAGQAIPALNEDETYTLEVTEKQAVLKAPTVIGALRGLESFLQL